MDRSFVLILGNQLFEPRLLKKKWKSDEKIKVFMREDVELCTYFKFHKQKIVFFLAAMREYADELSKFGADVHYEKLEPGKSKESYEDSITTYVKTNRITRVCFYEIEDKFFETRLLNLFKKLKVECEVWPSPMFLTNREQFESYLKRHKRPFMKTFYQEQRRRLDILIDSRSEPVGGQWSFDEDNRKALPKSIVPPSLPKISTSEATQNVIELCQQMFSKHPGSADGFWLPVNRKGARRWLDSFIEERLESFGPYEDAIPGHSEFLFHSVLTPFLNTGLLTPSEVIDSALSKSEGKKINLASLEGFIRQVIGWREFVRGIYRHYSDRQDSTNFWKHSNKLSNVWYSGDSGIPVLDRAIDRVNRHGYLHHIERLMVVGSLMLLLEVDPKEGHRWFMEMFIDSSDWVMGPNVYGMALFSDGGIFATKPYICGSNYYRKMSGDPKGDWCDGVDGLYWSFIEKHKSFFMKNPRLSMMARSLEKMDPKRLSTIKAAANKLRKRLVVQ